MKYRLLMHPDGSDCYLEENTYTTVDDAVRAGMAYGTDNFLVITIIDWEVVTKAVRAKSKNSDKEKI